MPRNSRKRAARPVKSDRELLKATELDARATLAKAEAAHQIAVAGFIDEYPTKDGHGGTLAMERQAIRRNWLTSQADREKILARQVRAAINAERDCDSIRAAQFVLAAEIADDNRLAREKLANKSPADNSTTVIVQNLNQPTQDLLKTIDPAIFRAAAEREQLESQQGLVPGVPPGTPEPKTASENQARADKPAATEDEAKPGYRPGRNRKNKEDSV